MTRDQFPIILSFETATLGGSICVLRGETILVSSAGDPSISHSNSLLPGVEKLLAKASIALDEVEVFAVATGPGSFTGLRIGLATTKALAATLSRPCVGVPTLHAIAHAAGKSEATVAVLPAGRGEVFTQLLSVSLDGTVVELDRPIHLSPQQMLERYGGREDLLWAGEGAHLHWEEVSAYLEKPGSGRNGETQDEVGAKSKWQIAPKPLHPACNVAALALVAYWRGEVSTPQALSALYVRPSDAELALQRK